jgi:hypothetical protein
MKEILVSPPHLPINIAIAEPNNGQNSNPRALPSFRMIMSIVGGYSMEFENKRYRIKYYR